MKLALVLADVNSNIRVLKHLCVLVIPILLNRFKMTKETRKTIIKYPEFTVEVESNLDNVRSIFDIPTLTALAILPDGVIKPIGIYITRLTNESLTSKYHWGTIASLTINSVIDHIQSTAFNGGSKDDSLNFASRRETSLDYDFNTDEVIKELLENKNTEFSTLKSTVDINRVESPNNYRIVIDLGNDLKLTMDKEIKPLSTPTATMGDIFIPGLMGNAYSYLNRMTYEITHRRYDLKQLKAIETASAWQLIESKIKTYFPFLGAVVFK